MGESVRGELTTYPLPIAEWCRTIWVSPAAREVWEPRISAISRAYEATERASVGVVRQCALQSCAPDQLPELSLKAVSRGLQAIVLAQQGSSGSYQAASVSLSQATSWQYRIVLATPDAASAFSQAWESSDDNAIGALLGTPPCCRQFFADVWKGEGHIDTTPRMAGVTDRKPTVEVSGPVEANILLRWLGVRAVSHLPCSFDCKHTAALGRRMLAVMREGFSQEAEWLRELLSCPIEWSAWHGIAEIKHPLFKISAKSIATPGRIAVRREGTNYPAEGAKGIAFPYRRTAQASTVISLSSLRRQPEPDVWTDNGFSSQAAMEAAHQTIRGALAGCAGPFLDLGAGNGELLAKLGGGVGIEIDEGRAAKGRARGRDIRTGRIQDVASLVEPEALFGVALISQRRREELSAIENAALDAWLKSHVSQVLTYSYDSPMFQRLDKVS